MHGLTGGGWKRKRLGHGHHGWDDLAGNRGNTDPGTYHHTTPPRLPPTLLRTGNAAKKFRQVDDYVVGRLRGLMIKKRGRNLHAGQAQQWTEDWFNGLGLYRLRGTIQYPKAA